MGGSKKEARIKLEIVIILLAVGVAKRPATFQQMIYYYYGDWYGDCERGLDLRSGYRAGHDGLDSFDYRC